jgi:hypothetical protein
MWRRWRGRTLGGLGLLALGSPVPAITLHDPAHFAALRTWSASQLGVPTHLGGLVFDPAGGTLYVVGAADTSASGLWAVPVTRAGDGSIAAFGTASLVFGGHPATPGLDAGVAFGPDGTLFFTYFEANFLGERPGGPAGTETRYDLALADVPRAASGLAFAPGRTDPASGAGMLQVSVGFGREVLDVPLVPAGGGLFAPGRAARFAALPASGNAGLAYVPGGTFAGDLLIAHFAGGALEVLVVDPATGLPIDALTGLPAAGTDTPDVRPLATGLGEGPIGLAFDPLAPDRLYVSTFGGTPPDSVMEIAGFAATFATSTSTTTTSTSTASTSTSTLATATSTTSATSPATTSATASTTTSTSDAPSSTTTTVTTVTEPAATTTSAPPQTTTSAPPQTTTSAPPQTTTSTTGAPDTTTSTATSTTASTTAPPASLPTTTAPPTTTTRPGDCGATLTLSSVACRLAVLAAEVRATVALPPAVSRRVDRAVGHVSVAAAVTAEARPRTVARRLVAARRSLRAAQRLLVRTAAGRSVQPEASRRLWSALGELRHDLHTLARARRLLPGARRSVARGGAGGARRAQSSEPTCPTLVRAAPRHGERLSTVGPPAPPRASDPPAGGERMSKDPPATDPERWLWTCPNCGARLQPRQCKTRCLRCGFFTDCSDTGV